MSEKRLSGETVYKGRILSLDRDEVLCDNGNKGVREVVRHGGGAAILAVKDGKILIEKQYRYALGKEIYEIPAGKREKDEDFFVTAKRELEEETGLIPKDLKKLVEIYPSPGYTTEKIAIFVATKFGKGEKHFDDTEDITSEWIDVGTLMQMIGNGEIEDAKTVVALSLWSK
ncbi:MAG TPA: hypothetical protein DDW54_00565 [Clostridiales bacterium]|nr:hypothetical protein [Clostridiales bacterium]